MALIVEGGTGMDDAQAYISVADATTFFELYGVPPSWEGATVEQQEQALRVGARWLDSAVRWPSTPLEPDQALAWPRVPFFDGAGNYVEGVPKLIKEANAEVAALHLESPIFAASRASVKMESWGDSSIMYAGSSVSAYQSRLDAILKSLSRYGGNSVNIIETFRA